jgi:hypothetical protein
MARWRGRVWLYPSIELRFRRDDPIRMCDLCPMEFPLDTTVVQYNPREEWTLVVEGRERRVPDERHEEILEVFRVAGFEERVLAALDFWESLSNG